MLDITAHDPAPPSRAAAVPKPSLRIFDDERRRRGERAFAAGDEVGRLGRYAEEVGAALDAEVLDVVVEDDPRGWDDDARAPITVVR